MTATRRQPIKPKPAGAALVKKLKDAVKREVNTITERVHLPRGDWEQVIKALNLKDLKVIHNVLKATRQRGTETPSHLASVKYLKALEAEMKQISSALDEAWIWIDDSKDYRRASKHMDRAQQRMHRIIKRLGK